jgi:hypothetical protein
MPSELFETLPLLNFDSNPHDKHNVSQKSLTTLGKVAPKHDNDPFEKCGKAEIIHLLKMGLRSDIPKDYIELALDLLTVEGKGK